MTGQRTPACSAYDDLRLDGEAGPARPVSAARQARMIDAAILAAQRTVEGSPQDSTAARGSAPGRAAIVDFMMRHAVVAVAVLLGSGGVAVAGFAIASAVETHEVEEKKEVAFPLPSPRSVIRVLNLQPASDIPATPEAPLPSEPSAGKERHQNYTRVAPDLLARANALRAQGNWRKAALTYKQAAQAAPRSDLAYVATFAMATLEAEHFESPQRALRLFRELLLLRPQGTLTEEVHLGIGQAYRRLGARSAELSALQQFINRYPQSLAAPRVRARLSVLQDP